MSELQQNRYDQLLRRIGDLKGPGSKVSDVISELFPMIDVERVPGELLALMGTKLAFGGVTVLSAAGEAPRIQLFNPVDSNALVVPTGVTFSSDTAQRIRLAVSTAALSVGVGIETFRDSRFPLTSRPIGQLRTDSTMAQTDGRLQFDVQANENITLSDPNGLAVLSAGSGFEIGGNTNATRIFVNYFWRERPAEPSELNL